MPDFQRLTRLIVKHALAVTATRPAFQVCTRTPGTGLRFLERARSQRDRV